jgi:2-methylisocitrate lyase-like PEP mutase family enzyme
MTVVDRPGVQGDRIERFRALHDSGCFALPNPFDVGTARLLESLGFQALATTSAGFAASLGRTDMSVTLDELLQHTAAITRATSLPLNVDAERCFAETATGVTANVASLARAGAAGCSIEDWNPATAAIDPLDVAAERVAAAVGSGTGIMVTARCENHIRGVKDLDDTIARLTAYRAAGADAVYAPGLIDLAEIQRVVDEVGAPVNVLALPGGPSVSDLDKVGVRRVSVGSLLALIGYGAFAAAATAFRDTGSIDPAGPFLDRRLAAEAFAARG